MADASLSSLTPRVTRAWYVLAPSDRLGATPRVTRLHGTPVVLWRDRQGVAHALEDRCPHRGVPLSDGHVDGDDLRCGYHGWRFAGDGRCTEIPGLPGAEDVPGRGARSYPVVEQQGFVWAWADPDTPPEGQPYRFPHADDPAYLVAREAMVAKGPVHQVIENALDVPHTAFLHGGLFRRADTERRPVRCRIERTATAASCHFEGEDVPKGLAGRLLAPGGGQVQHVDRFLLPSITEVEYRLGDDAHVVLNGACTPLDDWTTVMHAVVQVRSRIPGFVVRPIFGRIARRIFDQDAVVLARQTEALHARGAASFASTELDVLGGQVLGMMRRAAKGEIEDEGTRVVREVTMWL